MPVELLVVVIAGVFVVVFANSLSKRTGVAGPLILLAVGVAVSLIPAVSAVSIAPALILTGVLPPLLFSAAVSAPAIEFRRDFSAISGLSVLLVIISSLVLGCFFFWAIPEIGFPLAVALGAILSPTDAVATSIVRKLGVPRRVVTVLEGESLLNDATALVLLRTAIVAAASGFSLLTTLGSLAWAVVSAIVIGTLAGLVALRLRAWTTSATANTALGLTVPYLAFLPTEAVGGSGLVAAVAAGVVCGQGAVRWLTPEQRISDKLNWRTIAFLLEGAVFLVMGLQLYGIVQNNLAADEGLLRGIWIAALAFVILVVVRAAYVIPMLSAHSARVKRSVRSQLDASATSITKPADAAANRHRRLSSLPGAAAAAERKRSPKRIGRMRADIDYFDASPLTWKHNTIIIWAGMRGAVTLAAAQTLPDDAPNRDLLVFIAFLVAAGSLLLQGLTLPALARLLRLRSAGEGGLPRAEIRVIDSELRAAAEGAIAGGTLLRPDRTRFAHELYSLPRSRFVAPLDPTDAQGGPDALEFELALVRVMRARLHELGRSGRHSTSALRYVLDELDAYEISVKLHLESEK
ncbi:cation:proton antiporter [Agromyces cerinus]|uniref:Monovalent cation:H+ antiporter, CPA1 family n=1 Tax=Agromyces cerinus subsp. cerinus TaxID=232089 RepID=A0A1N6IB41_9MICO|nr:sodium:proton antiporter [Agromyces cerinus]SIO29242.1 monovalent cation:H+ antiporter, CPA1 family [Agromyces cerinus subsp. cerinus]